MQKSSLGWAHAVEFAITHMILAGIGAGVGHELAREHRILSGAAYFPSYWIAGMWSVVVAVPGLILGRLGVFLLRSAVKRGIPKRFAPLLWVGLFLMIGIAWGGVMFRFDRAVIMTNYGNLVGSLSGMSGHEDGIATYTSQLGGVIFTAKLSALLSCTLPVLIASFWPAFTMRSGHPTMK